MTKITSKAAFFRAANGRQVTKTVTGMATIEDAPAIEASIRKQCQDEGIPAAEITKRGHTLHCGNYVYMLPKRKKSETGTFGVSGSNIYLTTESGEVWCHKSLLKLDKDAGTVYLDTVEGGRVTYSLAE